MKILVLLNSAAGTLLASTDNSEAQHIAGIFERHGHEATVRTLESGNFEQAARAALAEPFEVIIAGGGDGTALTVANVIRGSDKAFSVLPLGTFNHFAKDLGLPGDLDAAARALAHGQIRELPVGEMNGQIFLNFCAIGLHPEMVRHRDAQQQRIGGGKWPAMIIALLRVLRRFSIHRVTLVHDGRRIVRYTPSVIVCNNRYQMEAFGMENASEMSRDLLNVYIAGETRRAGLIWLIIRAMFGTLEHAKNFEAMALREFELSTWRRSAGVSIDGEVADMRMPLKFAVREHLLRVLAPAKQNDE